MGAQATKTTGVKRGTDWPRLLLDLRAAGVSVHEVARRIGRPRPTVQSWGTGCEPRHADGEALLELWAAIVGKQLG